AVFWMLTLLAYAWYVRRPGWQRYLAVMTSLALGLMAKPMLVTLPAVLLLLDYWPLGRVTAFRKVPPSPCPLPPKPGASGVERKPSGPQRAPRPVWRSWQLLVLEKIPFFVLVAAVSVATWLAQEGGGTIINLEKCPMGVRLQNAVIAYAVYVCKM